jgi:hypothetical protein
VDSEIEKLRVNLSSNQNAATQLRTELSDIDAAPVEGADDTIAKKLELSGHLLKINEEERDFTAQLQSLLEGKAKVALNDSQSECDKVIASTKELYSDQSEKLVGEKQSIGEQQESVSTEKELAEMQYQESEAAIQAELDTLRVRETALQVWGSGIHAARTCKARLRWVLSLLLAAGRADGGPGRHLRPREAARGCRGRA